MQALRKSTAIPTESPPSAFVQVPLEAAGTSEAMPILFIRSSIMDDETGAPVHGNVFVVDSFELALFGDINAWLIMVAPGYEMWRLRLSFDLKTSRELTGPVRLKRAVAAQIPYLGPYIVSNETLIYLTYITAKTPAHVAVG